MNNQEDLTIDQLETLYSEMKEQGIPHGYKCKVTSCDEVQLKKDYPSARIIPIPIEDQKGNAIGIEVADPKEAYGLHMELISPLQYQPTYEEFFNSCWLNLTKIRLV